MLEHERGALRWRKQEEVLVKEHPRWSVLSGASSNELFGLL
jgi:hypothetical protein